MPIEAPATTSDRRCDVHLGVDPFVSNRYHFGMLLGVADLEAEQAYHRGKTWMHTAWLHGSGTVWGLGVEVRADRNELVVHPGLAVDGHGRELRVLDDLCVDLGRWYAERRPEDLEVEVRDDGGIVFVAHVVLCHDGCLDRPVPSISEPCEDATYDTAYSRTVERGVPMILAGPPPDEPIRHPRIRQLFGHVPTDDDLVVAARDAIDAAEPDQRAATCVAWLRRLLAADTIGLEPDDGVHAWSPVSGDGCVTLARIEVHLRPSGDRFVIVDDGDAPTDVDDLVRRSHLPTRTIQELACCCTSAAGPVPAPDPDDGGPEPGPGDDTDEPVEPVEPEPNVPTGPQVRADDVVIDGTQITIPLTDPVDARTVVAAAFGVAALRANQWATINVRSATVDDAGTTITVTLTGSPRARPVRVVVPGAGVMPILGVDGRPLDGVAGSGPSDPTGRDAALLLTEGEDPA